MKYIPKISIIIPCYNSQDTLNDTLNSILNQEFDNWEALIINDGSTSNLEQIALEWVKRDSRFRYFKKVNGGLGSARNYGIMKAKGKYILPLDSDNKISLDFASSGIQIFEAHNNVGIVYGNAMYFGEKNGIWHVGDFNHFKMLDHNYIDACALIRKDVFDKIGCYDENLPHQGHEDWEFWLRVMKSDYNFYYLKQITFHYRVSSDSMINTFNNEMLKENINYIKQKHSDLYIKAYSRLFKENERNKNKLSIPIIKRILKKSKFFDSKL